jgi:hypothetical protein
VCRTKGAVALDDAVGERGLEELALPLPALGLPREPLLVKVGRHLIEELLDRIKACRVVARIDRLDQFLVRLELLLFVLGSLVCSTMPTWRHI